MAQLLHPDRLFPVDAASRDTARSLYAQVRDLPIISPHGHTDPDWFADDENFENATSLLVTPDHYVFRMLYSQGISLEKLGIPPSEADPKEVWRLFAENFYLFRGTPTELWFHHVFSEVFGLNETLNKENADHFYDEINKKLSSEEFKPRALFERFKIEVLSTTDCPTDSLRPHETIRKDWDRRVLPCFRPDAVVDPEYEGFAEKVSLLAETSGEDTTDFAGYLRALKNRRQFFKEMGATSTDHGHADAYTVLLDKNQAEEIYLKALQGKCSAAEARAFRGHMLIEFAKMSLEDGLVMQLHPGSFRNHNQKLFQNFGRDKGADIPTPTNYVQDLQPLLNAVGNEKDFTFIIFTLDETTYSRELAPLAGHYPCLKVGPPWWFHDSPEGMRRYYENMIETAGFYNTVGFNDDTRAFLSIPARHDVFRRMLCRVLSTWVHEHRLSETAAFDLAKDLSYNLVKKAYKL